MPRKKSVKKILEEREIAREIRKKELEAEYDEQENIARNHGAESLRLFQKLKPTKKWYIDRGLEKWDDEEPVIVMGRFQDNIKALSTFQQRFIDCVRTCFPSVIEDLKEFVPFFDRFFGENRNVYDRIFDWNGIELWNANDGLETCINTEIRKFLETRKIFTPLIYLSPYSIENLGDDFRLGQYRLLFEFLDLSIQRENVLKKSDIDADAAFEFLRKNIEFSSAQALPPNNDHELFLDEVGKILVQKYINSPVFPEFVDKAKRSLKQSFQNISPDAELDIDSFIKLHLGILRWAEKYNLEKDWILKYAYFFLSKFSIDPNLDIQKVKTPSLSQRSLMTNRFAFKFDGWFPGDETRQDYENRLRTEFESSLEQFFQLSGKQLKLDSVKKTTKPLKYDVVRWNVYGVLRKWGGEQILEKFFPEIAANRTKNEISAIAYENKLKVLRKEIRRMSEFELPVPRNL
jgi:hypothetical protein